MESLPKILITGATSDIGRAIASACAVEGYPCVLLGRSISTIKALASELSGKGHLAVEVDLCAEDIRQQLDRRLQGLMIAGIVHAAGYHSFAGVTTDMMHTREQIFRVNFGAFIELVSVCVRRRLFAPSGASVIALSSVAAHRGQVALTSYGASRAATVSAIKSLARELAPKNVRVNTLSLGWVNTTAARSIVARLSDEQQVAALKAYPLGIGRPEDVANSVRFLLSDQSRWMTGTDIVLDGGFLA